MKFSSSFLRSLILAAACISVPAFADSDAPINVNTADAETLAQVLNGVGEKRAQAIVKWRQQHGPFQSIEQLTEVRGVGGEILARNRDRVTVE